MGNVKWEMGNELNVKREMGNVKGERGKVKDNR
jgi:hypothetical protein